MEKWQKEYIKSNLSSLLDNTLINAVLLAILEQEDVLSQLDVEKIMAKDTNYDQVKLLLDILVTKSNGYYTLIKALTETKQSGASKLLFHPSEKIGELRVHFQGITHQLKTMLNTEQITNIQTWLRQHAFTKEHVKTLKDNIKNQTEVKLLHDSIPKPYSQYIPRFLSRRLDVSVKLFETDCSDVFVFKHIERAQLRKFVPTEYGIETSTIQLLTSKITARFILLRSESDWERIRAKIEVPVHLLRYDVRTETFVLEKSSGASTVLRNHLKEDCHTECMSEDVFVEKVLKDNVNGVCICDSPGTGKSDLLANLARKVNDRCPQTERIVAYIQLQNFVAQDELNDNLRLTILKNIATTPTAYQILCELISDQNIKFELFFDGLDEVQEVDLKKMTTFLQKLCESKTVARIFVTSRPVVRSQLEKTVGVIAYDILPFTEEIQRNYLTSHWANKYKSSCDIQKLTEYADFCLVNLKGNLNENERKLTGVPLLCRLIAEVYGEQAAVFADRNRSVSVNLLSVHFANSLSDIYSKFIVRQLGESKCNLACMYKDMKAVCDPACHVIGFHVFLALQLVCPDLARQLSMDFNEFNGVSSLKVLSPGLLEQNPSTRSFEFVHRTFAEYLVAIYLCKALFVPAKTFQSTKIGLMELRFLQRGAYEEIFGDRSFVEEVLVYFINDFLMQNHENCELSITAAYIPFGISLYSAVELCLWRNYEALLMMVLGKRNCCSNDNAIDAYTIPLFLRLCRDPKMPFLGVILVTFVLLPLDVLVMLSEAIKILIKGPQSRFRDSEGALLKIAAENCNAKVVKLLCQFFQEKKDLFFLRRIYLYIRSHVFPRNYLKNSSPSNESSTLLQIAVERADYEMVSFFITLEPLHSQGLLYFCAQNTYFEDDEIVDKRLDIAQLLLSKQSDLLTEVWKSDECKGEYKTPLLAENVHFKAIKFFIEHGADVNVSTDNGNTVLYNAATYMLVDEFFELCEFLLSQSSSASCLFNDIKNVEPLCTRFPDMQTECKTKYTEIMKSLSIDEETSLT